jgi:hypothetical protein
VTERIDTGSDETTARRLPWVTHAVVAVGLFALQLWMPISEYGLTRTDPYPMLWMSWGIRGAVWILVVPAVVIEVWASARSGGWRWVARVSVCVTTVVLAWFGSLPVGLRFFGDRDPVTYADVSSAVVNYAVLLAGYVLLVLVLNRVIRSWIRSSSPGTGLHPGHPPR